MKTTSKIAREGGCEVLVTVFTNKLGVIYGAKRKATLKLMGRHTVLQFRGPKSWAACWILPSMKVVNAEFAGHLADGSFITGRML